MTEKKKLFGVGANFTHTSICQHFIEITVERGVERETEQCHYLAVPQIKPGIATKRRGLYMPWRK